MNITKEFIDYWDKTIQEWWDKGLVPVSESLWFDGVENPPHPLMPGPYMGNPAECSIAILNYNPGRHEQISETNPDHYKNQGKKSISKLMSPKYSEYAMRFPFWEEDPECPFGCHPGYQWWQIRKKWVNRFVPDTNKRPFALELCAWRSHQWKEIVKIDSPQHKYIEEKLIPIFKEAIKNSDLKIGLSIGKDIGDVLKEAEFEDITHNLINQKLDNSGWKPSDKNRWYRVYFSKKDRIYILNTYSIGSNIPPSKEFEKIEIEIINKIKNNYL